MKPMLFSTDMVRAIQDNRKTVTRRLCNITVNGDMAVTCKLCCAVRFPEEDKDGLCAQFYDKNNFYQGRSKPPYTPGDILYVRETFCWCYCWDCGMDTEDGCVDETAEKFYNPEKGEWGCFGYRASFEENEHPFGDRWQPSIHMPREAARIFLRVTEVRVERLQDITKVQAEKEGQPSCSGLTVCGGTAGCHMCEAAYENAIRWFEGMWNSTIKLADRAIYGWAANPWVWVIEFERISREEAVNHAVL